MKFKEQDMRFRVRFREVNVVSDGGYEKGYAAALKDRTDLVVTENGEYFPEGKSSGFNKVTAVIHDPFVSEKKVMFVDYDGVVLYAYDVEEIKAMTELPPLPSHDGLICEGWNWTLDEIKQYIADFEEDHRYLYPFDVGAIYITDDGATRLCINLVGEYGNDVRLIFTTNVKGGVRVDWGDGTETTLSKSYTAFDHTHNYEVGGRYVISIFAIGNATITLGNSSNGIVAHETYAGILEKVFLGTNISSTYYSFFYQTSLKSITIPSYITTLSEGMFQGCRALRYVNLPREISTINNYVFRYSGIERITMPLKVETMGKMVFGADSYKNVTIQSVTFRSPVLGEDMFNYCTSLRSVNLAKSTKVLTYRGFLWAYGVRTLYIPRDVEEIKGSAIPDYVRVLDCTSCRNIPTLGSNALKSNFLKKILIPMHKLNVWKAATNWSAFANYMVGVEVDWASET